MPPDFSSPAPLKDPRQPAELLTAPRKELPFPQTAGPHHEHLPNTEGLPGLFPLPGPSDKSLQKHRCGFPQPTEEPAPTAAGGRPPSTGPPSRKPRQMPPAPVWPRSGQNGESEALTIPAEAPHSPAWSAGTRFFLLLLLY